jgi:hypothetical protein
MFTGACNESASFFERGKGEKGMSRVARVSRGVKWQRYIYLQVPSRARARSTMRCTRPRTVLSSSSVLKRRRVWKFPVRFDQTSFSRSRVQCQWLPARIRIIIHHPLHAPRQYTKCQSVRCLVECHTRVEGAWKWAHCATFQSQHRARGRAATRA